jgi:hypothetical protein
MDTFRLETSPRAFLGSPGAFNRRKSVQETEHLNQSFDESMMTMRASEELLCGCECKKKGILSRHCQNAQSWLDRFFPDNKFDYVMFSKTYECFL